MTSKKQKIIDAVIERIKMDMLMRDDTALDELLSFTPTENLLAYLPEKEWKDF